MYQIIYSNNFRKDLKRVSRSGRFQQEKLEYLICLLNLDVPLPAQYKNHKLQGEYKDLYECHVYPDMLLIYEKDCEFKLITLMELGNHSELFG